MNAGVAPARRGKDSSKDCLVYETYLEAVAALRGAGVAAPIVFLSSPQQGALYTTLHTIRYTAGPGRAGVKPSLS